MSLDLMELNSQFPWESGGKAARSDLICCDLNSWGVSTARRDTAANVNCTVK